MCTDNDEVVEAMARAMYERQPLRHKDGEVLPFDHELNKYVRINLFADATAALAAYRTAAWRPIETAPKDGTRMLVYRPSGRYNLTLVGVDLRDNHYDGTWWHSRQDEQPTHWQPMPQPPETTP